MLHNLWKLFNNFRNKRTFSVTKMAAFSLLAGGGYTNNFRHWHRIWNQVGDLLRWNRVFKKCDARRAITFDHHPYDPAAKLVRLGAWAIQ
ncbi:hypothetical protein [Ralstonia pseudosolanacearum]|uniref:hypothetical protein n=1 Tax=Ralstonia pseudosolanacearum TaxID=1310165 RepID=UPI001E631541|nr:hypothetical protein [Ralstonia pseudosolanacearum]